MAVRVEMKKQEERPDKQMRTYPFVPNGVRFRYSGRVAAPWRGSLRLGP